MDAFIFNDRYLSTGNWTWMTYITDNEPAVRDLYGNFPDTFPIMTTFVKLQPWGEDADPPRVVGKLQCWGQACTPAKHADLLCPVGQRPCA